MNNKAANLFTNGMTMDTFELNRLVVEEALPKNTLSMFLSRTFKLLPKPCLLMSFADPNNNHHGYIYQATNWIYTGETSDRNKFYDSNGKEVHKRTLVSRYGTSKRDEVTKLGIEIRQQIGKYRYFQFIGSKTQIKIMKTNFKYQPLPYPKGDNVRYDSSDKSENYICVDSFIT